jgi:uncharacterized protein YodC (DUF2158 family)
MPKATVGFQVGDLVVLKSGGPVMTVVSNENAELTGQIHCSWFSGKKHEAGWFPPAALNPAPKEDQKP